MQLLIAPVLQILLHLLYIPTVEEVINTVATTSIAAGIPSIISQRNVSKNVKNQALIKASENINQTKDVLQGYVSKGIVSGKEANSLLEKLGAVNQSVKEIKIYKNSVRVNAKEAFEGNTVVLAIPPKLWAKKIIFEPHLPSKLMNVAKQTHTWMEDSIKIALTYNKPFWQEDNISGTLFSNVGPITELYDHCNHERSKYALCGFINSSFKNLTYEERRAGVINQIKNIFGMKAEEFIDYEECIWSKEENTYEASDIFLFPHQNNGNPIFNKSFFDDKLLISSAESASEFPGYMDGAVYAANETAKKLREVQQRT